MRGYLIIKNVVVRTENLIKIGIHDCGAFFKVPCENQIVTSLIMGSCG
jgi:hypothetical protein